MKLFNTLLAASALLCGLNASAANLWIVGEATSTGWSLDDATALLSTNENPDVFTGTLYLKDSGTFKFLTTTDWGNEEIGSAPDATLADGKINLAKGTNDEGYGQLSVGESANYQITVDTATLKATITKAEYQETEINLCSLFMVGSATEGDWSVDAGTPLFQNQEEPYVFAANNQAMKEGTFKIATVIKGGGTWDAKYWYFRDAEDADKIALGQEGDIQWNIAKAEDYNITVDILANTISIKEAGSTSTSVQPAMAEEASPEYYNLQGVTIANSTSGLYLRKVGNEVKKVIL